MNKLTFLLAATVIALGGLGYGQYERNKVLGAQNKSLAEAVDRAVEREKRDRKVLVARQAEIASQALKLKKTERALSDALSANPAWADAPVPANIQEVLTNGS
jgi:uncharacterized protein HemX